MRVTPSSKRKGVNTMNTTTVSTQRKAILLSKKGAKELRKSISQLEHDRLAILRSIRESDKSSGHDDRFERNERLLRLEAIDAELSEKRHILSNAKLISSKRTRVKVAIGSVVNLIDQQGRLFQYTLVESFEANPSEGRISALSPLGSSLIGKTAHDIVEWGNGINRSRLRLINIA